MLSLFKNKFYFDQLCRIYRLKRQFFLKKSIVVKIHDSHRNWRKAKAERSWWSREPKRMVTKEQCCEIKNNKLETAQVGAAFQALYTCMETLWLV